MTDAFICGLIRAPSGRFDGAPPCSGLDPVAVGEMIFTGTSPPGEDNRDVAGITPRYPFGLPARMTQTTARTLDKIGEHLALLTLGVGEGQGVAMALEHL